MTEASRRNPALAAIDARRRLKSRFRNREPIFLSWVSLGHPSIAEMLSASGVDAIGLDIEHSTISLEQTQRLIAAAQSADVPCLPRPASWSRNDIVPMLDSGADGLILPMVNRPEQINEIVDVMKFPPVGERSFGVNRAQGYGTEIREYAASWNSDSILIIQIEHPEAVESVHELLSFAEVDGVMIGPLDLSGRLGELGNVRAPIVSSAIDKVIDACRSMGKSCGIQLPEATLATVEEYLDRGINFLVLESDIFTLQKWAESTRQLIHKVPRHE